MKRLVTGILAHVDAGKTTLSEGLLYLSGEIRKMGRVDDRDAFLDTYELEKKRGITIFSKQARLRYGDLEITLLDTPGHVDFSAEMERTLQVLDCAVLLVSGSDGVQGHTRTLWRLLRRYGIPAFLFFNKMDQPGTDPEKLLRECREKLGDGIVDFSSQKTESFYENIAVCEESLLERFLETGCIEQSEIVRLVAERKLFPCFFGSALRLEGVEELLRGLRDYAEAPAYRGEDAFAARVYKISRDRQGNRLTFLKVTGGTLRIREELSGAMPGEEGGLWREKVTQIRIYSGEKYDAADIAETGGIYAVTGLSYTMPGDGLGAEGAAPAPVLEPILTYAVYLPDDVKHTAALPKLKQLEEEEPELHVLWEESLQEIHVQLMGPIQLEVLQAVIAERFRMGVRFGPGRIVYKETIAGAAEGVGHFEPLRHYAEVQLLLEPGERGSGVQVSSACSEDMLGRNWQRLVLTHLEERKHRGVLTGSVITDVRITLTGGKAHLKHTEGGDFRQAAYRAVRQGLMQAQSVLLEPYYEFALEIPARMTGRAMTDLERMHAAMTIDIAAAPERTVCEAHGEISPPETVGGTTVLRGQAPAVCLQDYQLEVAAYTGGQGHLTCVPAGYAPCHNAAEVIERIGYDPEADVRNPSSSVFCAHGAGFLVPWHEAPAYMHVESGMKGKAEAAEQARIRRAEERAVSSVIGTEEIDAILAGASHANSRPDAGGRKWNAKGKGKGKGGIPAKTLEYSGEGAGREAKPAQKKQEYLLVDGYNIIFAWEELKELSEVNIDGARGRLLDILCNYQGMRGCEVIAVFDAYRVKGHDTEMLDYHNIHVVYTKEAETADQYIERFSHENSKKYDVTVATSDGLEQIIIRGQGCRLLSARDLKYEIDYYSQNLKEDYLGRQDVEKRYLLDGFGEKILREMEKK